MTCFHHAMQTANEVKIPKILCTVDCLTTEFEKIHKFVILETKCSNLIGYKFKGHLHDLKQITGSLELNKIVYLPAIKIEGRGNKHLTGTRNG